jgi:hypothetical protein
MQGARGETGLKKALEARQLPLILCSLSRSVPCLRKQRSHAVAGGAFRRPLRLGIFRVRRRLSESDEGRLVFVTAPERARLALGAFRRRRTRMLPPSRRRCGSAWGWQLKAFRTRAGGELSRA